MYSIEDYIGQKVRRISFIVKKANDGKYHHLLSVVEYLFPDMQDFDEFKSQKKTEYIDFLKDEDGNKDKVFFVVDFPVLTKEFLSDPQIYKIADDKVYPWDESKYRGSWKYEKPVIVPLHKDEKGILAHILPKRTTSAYVNVFKPEKPITIEKRIEEQVKKMSVRNLGRDFTLYPEFYGGTVVACYNPYYNSLDLTEDASAPGIFIRINFRNNAPKQLMFRFKTYSDDNSVTSIDPLLSTDGAFLNHFDFPHPFSKVDIDVCDADGRLIDYYDSVVFIHRINVEMKVKSKEVHVLNNKGETVKVIEKFAGEQFVIGNSKVANDDQKVAPEAAYKQSEDSLTCVFFDGDKDSVVENEQRAKETVMKILNGAKERCYICDMYFNIKTLVRFVMPVKLENVEVRIISSKEELNAKDIVELKEGCEAMREKDIVDVHCRLLRGEKAALHDRFLVADYQVWMVGCSLDEIGKRATMISRVPDDYSQKILDRIEEWWNNDDLSELIV
jgi:hypothetical protein